MNSVYTINKGINSPIQFKGLKAQYIWYLGGGLIALLVVFAVLYIAGVPSLICVAIALVAGTILFVRVYKLSDTYGEHGMMKKLARRGIPDVIRSYGRGTFLKAKS